VSCVRRYDPIVQESTSAISQGNRYVVRELQTEPSQFEIAIIDSLSRLYFLFCKGQGQGFWKRSFIIDERVGKKLDFTVSRRFFPVLTLTFFVLTSRPFPQ
jgi:hypothetical protein